MHTFVTSCEFTNIQFTEVLPIVTGGTLGANGISSCAGSVYWSYRDSPISALLERI